MKQVGLTRIIRHQTYWQLTKTLTNYGVDLLIPNQLDKAQDLFLILEASSNNRIRMWANLDSVQALELLQEGLECMDNNNPNQPCSTLEWIWANLEAILGWASSNSNSNLVWAFNSNLEWDMEMEIRWDRII